MAQYSPQGIIVNPYQLNDMAATLGAGTGDSNAAASALAGALSAADSIDRPSIQGEIVASITSFQKAASSLTDALSASSSALNNAALSYTGTDVTSATNLTTISLDTRGHR